MRTGWKFVLVLLLATVLCLRCKYSMSHVFKHHTKSLAVVLACQEKGGGSCVPGTLHSISIQVVGVFVVNGPVTLLAKQWKSFSSYLKLLTNQKGI